MPTHLLWLTLTAVGTSAANGPAAPELEPRPLETAPPSGTETPTAEIPPTEPPPTEAPPVEAPPVDAPPVDASPVDAPPVDAPPSEAQPSEAPPAQPPPADPAPADPTQEGEEWTDADELDPSLPSAPQIVVPMPPPVAAPPAPPTSPRSLEPWETGFDPARHRRHATGWTVGASLSLAVGATLRTLPLYTDTFFTPIVGSWFLNAGGIALGAVAGNEWGYVQDAERDHARMVGGSVLIAFGAVASILPRVVAATQIDFAGSAFELPVYTAWTASIQGGAVMMTAGAGLVTSALIAKKRRPVAIAPMRRGFAVVGRF